jgi:DNA-binding MurR/RpiR family transcriptional regulator
MVDMVGTSAGVSERARAGLSAMPSAEARVIEALLAQGADAIHLTVSEVAKTAGVGVGTVVRACQSAGFKGFQDAKIALAQDRVQAAPRVQEGVEPADAAIEILRKLAASTDDALQSAPRSVDPAALASAVDALASARKALFLAVGTSTPLASDAAYRFATIGLDAEAPGDVHAQHVRAGLLRAGDVAVVVSHTGSTTETISAAGAAKRAGATVVAITSFSTTPLTDLADIRLVAGGRETAYRVEAMTSRFAHLLVLDSLYVALYLKDPERSREAQERMADALSEHRF